jgi:hypothetical protein
MTSVPVCGLVQFPPGVTTRSLGRNGTFITVGIYVDSFRERITLTPRNSRGEAARGNIVLPDDSGVLLDFIREILKHSPNAREMLKHELASG